MSKRKLLSGISLCLFCLLLAGCTKNIELSAGKFPEDTQQLSIAVTAEDFALLDGFTALQAVDFSGSRLYDDILAWAADHPQVNVRYTVYLPDGQMLPNNAESLDLTAMSSQQLEESLSLLPYLPMMTQIQLPDNMSAEQILAVTEAHPQLTVDFRSSVLGIPVEPGTGAFELDSLSTEDAQALAAWGPLLSKVESIKLDCAKDSLNWDAICTLAQAYPTAVFEYDFTLYGMDFSLTDTHMDLNHIAIDDNGALVKKITGCMRNLEYLDMDSCGVSDEAMAEIRDQSPNAKVVWRIWFGERYSVRTDVEKILASNPGMGGELTPENTRSLQYCTRVKYLDLGHNSYLGDLSFLSCMPDLEVAILAMANWTDISPAADCPKLEYLELQTSSLNDVRPLSQLKNLRHLNIAYCVALTDISPLYELTELERLWIGRLTPIPPEQIEEMQRRAPDCEINTTVLDPSEGGWRYTQAVVGLTTVPRYELLRDQFEYHLGTSAYAYYYNDPLY